MLDADAAAQALTSGVALDVVGHAQSCHMRRRALDESSAGRHNRRVIPTERTVMYHTKLESACAAISLRKPEEIADITTKRDGYGIPNVHADTPRDLYSGYGYAVAQDRLFQMEMAKRSAIGTAAEVLGPDYVEIAKTARNSIDPQSIRDQPSALPKEEADIFDGYAEGFNRRRVAAYEARGQQPLDGRRRQDDRTYTGSACMMPDSTGISNARRIT